MRVLLLTPEYRGKRWWYSRLASDTRAGASRATRRRGSCSGGKRLSRGANRHHMQDGVWVEKLSYSRLRAWHSRFSAFNAMPWLRLELAAAWAMWEQSGFGERFDIIQATDYGLLVRTTNNSIGLLRYYCFAW